VDGRRRVSDTAITNLCAGEQKYRLTRKDNEFRQYRGRGTALLVKYPQVYHLKFAIRFTSTSGVTAKYPANFEYSCSISRAPTSRNIGQKLNFASESNE
jgi:hypothetical protein